MDYLVAAFSEAELDIATKNGANRLERHRLCIEILEPCGRNLACRGVLDDAHFRRNFDQVVTYEVAQARRVIRPVLGRLGARALVVLLSAREFLVARNKVSKVEESFDRKST